MASIFYRKQYYCKIFKYVIISYNFLNFRKKEIDAMLMEMIENQEKETENEKEQENGTSGQANGVEPERSDQEDEESGEVVACEYSCHSSLLIALDVSHERHLRFRHKNSILMM